MMVSTPNQKLLVVSKDYTGKHTILNLKALQRASIDLQGETFKLWLYLAKNQDGYKFALSMVDALSWGVGSKSSYYRGIKELENKIDGIFYWEPLWLPGDGICWASEAGQKYINEEGKSTANEWANQCLFDYSGQKLPAFKKYTNKEQK